MTRATTVAALRAAVGEARARGERVGLVPTMGALHAGHLAHVHRLRADAGYVVVSIFVNPLQFGAGEDLAAYPRDLGRDEAALGGLADLVWAPPAEVMYPYGEPATRVTVRGLTDVLEGASRPGHFDGVCTVVAKLLNQVQPDLVTFGRKDHQQLVVVRRMVADLDVPVSVVPVPTVREPDGLAMSSRNAYLGPADRDAACCVPRGLAAAVAVARRARAAGRPLPAGEVAREVSATIAAEPRADVDYVAVVDPDTLAPLDAATRGEEAGRSTAGRGSTPADDADRPQRALVAVAVRTGPARLIDNVVVGDEEDEDRLLVAVSG